jgi:hypothetical protein
MSILPKIERARQRLNARAGKRYTTYRDLAILYEGRSEPIPARAPDLSPEGMFINTPLHFPEGAVLKVSFRLTGSNRLINVRAEVRYCLPGVGIGLEFVDMSPESRRAIREELHDDY